MNAARENGQTHVRKVLDQLKETSNATMSGNAGIDEEFTFCGNPAEYRWRYIGKKEMLVPYHHGALPSGDARHEMQPHIPNAGCIRWEMHGVWIVEGTLRRGESNVLARRRFYVEEESCLILLGEGYDLGGAIVRCYMFHTSNTQAERRRGRWYQILGQKAPLT